MRLTCFAEDLELLQGLEPNDDGFYDSDEIREATDDHAQYLTQRVQLLDLHGDAIPPKLSGVTQMEIPEGGAKAGTLMQFTLGFELEFNYAVPPEFLTINQNMVAEGQLLPSELEVLVKQAGGKTSWRRMLKPNQPETIRFDWDNPPISQEDSEEEWENWFEQRRESTLGIESYSSVYAFLYITDREVRNEVLVPLASLATMIDFEREDEGFLSVEEQDDAAKKVRQFFSVGNPVRIDGIPVAPVIQEVQFYGLDLRDFATKANKRRVSMASGRVGVIINYPIKTPPDVVTVAWDKFSPAIRSVDAVVFANADVERFTFTPSRPDAPENAPFKYTAGDREPLPPLNEVDPTDPRYLAPWPTFSIGIDTILLFIAGVLVLTALVSKRFVTKDPSKQESRWPHTLNSIGVVILLAHFFVPDSATCEFPALSKSKGRIRVSDETADGIFRQLHQNLFRAFDYSDESQIYDALAQSVDGELLRKLYLEINDSLRIQEQGGAISRIEQVNLIDGSQQSDVFVPLGFRYRCKWNIVGTIEHWGHIHERTNQYDAAFDLKVVDGAWKIVAMDLIDQPQGVVKTRIRKF